MTAEPTTYAGVAKIIAETLESHYGIDPMKLFEQVGLEAAPMYSGDSRYPRKKIMELWAASAAATGDPCIGLVVGFKVRPTTFHALGFSWLSSRNLLGSLRRLCRYYRVIATVPLTLTITPDDRVYVLDLEFPDARSPANAIALDSFFASIVKLCRTATSEHFHPLKVDLTRADPGRAEEYIKAFAAPVHFLTDHNALIFDKESLEAPLPGENIDLARETDKILDDYLDALEPDQVASEVKKLLLVLLPSGNASQQNIAHRMNRSTSTLQRQLRAEGRNYRDICDETRRELSKQYVRDDEYSLGEIAYLLGFTDQSNFSRAFKRWTGFSPGEYRG